jgi:hypothetical protein
MVMNIDKEVNLLTLVVRRITSDATPFAWELRKDGVSLHVSAERYGNMEAAYIAGRTKLPDFLTKPTPASVRRQSVSTSRVVRDVYADLDEEATGGGDWRR